MSRVVPGSMRVGIVARRGSDRAAELAADARERLHESDIEVHIDEATAADLGASGSPVDRMDECDLVVAVGGDGTFLFAAREAETTPVMGINLGEVGFLNVTQPGDALAAIDRAVEQIRTDGEPNPGTLPRLATTGNGISLPPAVNEVVVMAERGPGRGATFAVEVDGSRYFESHGDGVLVATPAGSTAYNLSEGGPLVHPTVPALVITDMCGESAGPPLVVPTDSEIAVRVTDAETAVVIGDGRTRESFAPPSELAVSVADEPLRVAGPPLDFFTALDKLD